MCPRKGYLADVQDHLKERAGACGGLRPGDQSGASFAETGKAGAAGVSGAELSPCDWGYQAGKSSRKLEPWVSSVLTLERSVERFIVTRGGVNSSREAFSTKDRGFGDPAVKNQAFGVLCVLPLIYESIPPLISHCLDWGVCVC